MPKIRQEVIELGTAIKRCSPLIADNLAMPMSGKELNYLYTIIGRDYVMSLMFRGYTDGDYLKNLDHIGQIANAPIITQN